MGNETCSGRFTTPSVVAYEKNGAVQVGESAYHVLKGSKDVGNVLYGKKNLKIFIQLLWEFFEYEKKLKGK